MKITFIVDRSGSMVNLSAEATKQIKKMVNEYKGTDTRFNLVQFDTVIDTVVKNAKPGNRILKNYELVPRGGTALYDGIGTSSELIDPTEKNLILIITDGEENSSQRWTQEHIRPLIKAWNAIDNIEIMFVGAGVDSWDEASNLGLNRSFNSTGDVAGLTSTFTLANTTANCIATGLTPGETLSAQRAVASADNYINIVGDDVDSSFFIKAAGRRKGSQLRVK